MIISGNYLKYKFSVFIIMNKVLIKGWYNDRTCLYCKMAEDLLKSNFGNIDIIKKDIYPNSVPRIFLLV